MTHRVKVKVKLREFTYGKPGGGYETLSHLAEVILTPEVEHAIQAGLLEVVQEPPQIPENLEDLTMQELRNLAQALGLDPTGVRRKADLIAMIQAAQQGGDQ